MEPKEILKLVYALTYLSFLPIPERSSTAFKAFRVLPLPLHIDLYGFPLTTQHPILLLQPLGSFFSFSVNEMTGNLFLGNHQISLSDNQ